MVYAKVGNVSWASELLPVRALAVLFEPAEVRIRGNLKIRSGHQGRETEDSAALSGCHPGLLNSLEAQEKLRLCPC